jgi:hypothetical protein
MVEKIRVRLRCVRRRRRANPTLTTARTADRCRTTPAHADLGAASAASRDLQGARLGPFRRRNRGGSNEHMSGMAGCVTVRHSLRHTSPRPQPRQRLVTGAWNALETAPQGRRAPLRARGKHPGRPAPGGVQHRPINVQLALQCTRTHAAGRHSTLNLDPRGTSQD